MAWNEKVDKLKAKIKKAAADNDSVAHRNNEEEAKRLEVELGNITGTESCIGGRTRKETMIIVRCSIKPLHWLGIHVEDELPPQLQSSYAAGHIPHSVQSPLDRRITAALI